MDTTNLIIIVLAAVAFAVGVTTILMIILSYDLSQAYMEFAGFSVGVAGIGIGIFFAIRQEKQTKKMDKLISGTHITEQNAKFEVLRRIHQNTNGMRSVLIRTRFALRNHIQNSNKHPSEEVKAYINIQFKNAEKNRDAIKADIDIIALRIKDSRLITTFDREFLSPVVVAFGLLDMKLPTDTASLQATWENLGGHLRHLQQPLHWIENEVLRG
jgi:hypothetical protein